MRRRFIARATGLRLRCDELPAGLDYAVFDYGVNSGTGRAAKVMQRLLGIGSGTTMTDAVIAGALKAGPSILIGRLCDERLAFLKSLRTWPVFGTGWSRRVAEVRRDALAMANGAVVAPSASTAASGKAHVPQPKTARAATATGAVVAGAGAAQAAASSGCILDDHRRDRCSRPRVRRRRLDRLDAVAQAQAGATGRDAVRGGRIMSTGLAWLRERLKGWRTLIFGGAITIAGAALDILDALHVVDISPLLPPEHALKIIAVIGVVTVALRMVTTGRVGRKDC